MKIRTFAMLASLCAGMAVVLMAAPAGEAPASRPRVKLTVGAKAPAWDVSTVEGAARKLADFEGKPIVLQFGSITEPLFRAKVPAVEKLAEKHKGQAAFVIVYQQESHAADADALEINTDEGFSFAQPVTQAERVKLARMAIERLKISQQTVLVDSWDNVTSQSYGSYPNMTFLIDAKGQLLAGYPWMDVKKVGGALEAVLAGKPIPEEFKGVARASTIPALTAADGAMEMGGGAAGIAAVLDRIEMNEKQRAAIYGPLTQFLADLRDLRELRGGSKDDAVDAEALKKLLTSLQKQYDELKSVFKATLSEEDARKAIDALERTPGARILAGPRR